jgi:hypothetical protein
MSSPADPFSILHKGQSRAPQAPKAKILRYRQGVAPNKDENNDDDDNDNDDIFPNSITHFSNASDTKSIASSQFTTRTNENKDIKVPARRREVQRTVVVEDKEEDMDEEDEEVQKVKEERKMPVPAPNLSDISERVQRRLPQRKAPQEVATYSIPETDNKSSKNDNVEEVVVSRRDRVVKPREPESLPKKVHDEVALQALNVGKEEDNESDDAMEIEDEDDDDEDHRPNTLLKPVFVSKHERETKSNIIVEMKRYY